MPTALSLLGRSRLGRRAATLAAVALAAFAGLTCRDGGLTGPGLPTRISLALAPRLQTLAAGAPSVGVTRLTGVLAPPGGDAYSAEAVIANGVATLTFRGVTIVGAAQQMHLDVVATNAAGDTVYRLTRDIDVSADVSAPVDAGTMLWTLMLSLPHSTAAARVRARVASLMAP